MSTSTSIAQLITSAFAHGILLIRYTCLLLMLCFAMVGCRYGQPDNGHTDLSAYKKEIDAWHAERIEKVIAKDGWLNLLGLYWLQPGINTFGSDETNQIVFPDGTLEDHAGYFVLTDNRVEMHVNKGTSISLNGIPVIEKATVFNGDSTRQPQAANDRIAWTVIKRDGKFGIRVRDLTMRALQTFNGVERFPTDPAYRVVAAFVPQEGKTIDITNVLGQTTAQVSPGTLVFNWQEKEFTLDLLEGGKDEYFVIIADDTSGKESYGGGRYLYVKHAGTDGKIVLDFNKAYNPPCVFTPYATCPLPPRQNVLPFSILAGEKVYGHDAHAASGHAANM